MQPFPEQPRLRQNGTHKVFCLAAPGTDSRRPRTQHVYTAVFPFPTPHVCFLFQGSLPGHAAATSEAAVKMLVLVLCHEGFVKPVDAAVAGKVR